MYLYVKGINSVFVYNFGTVPTVSYFFVFFFHFYGMYTLQQMAGNKYIIIMIIRYFLNAVTFLFIHN